MHAARRMFEPCPFARIAVLLWLAAAATVCRFDEARAADAPARRPNVVLIVGDDQGWGDYSFMGHPHIRTPRIDRLAAEGLVFSRGYVPSSLCRPSLASILTGRYPHEHRIVSNDPPVPPGVARGRAEADPRFLADRQRMIAHIDRVATLPRILAEHGYASFQTGKWWEGNFARGGFTDGMSRGGRHGDEGLDIARKTMQPMFDFISRAQADGKPFLVWYAPFLPHTPHNPPERLLDKYLPKAPTPAVAKYWAMCEWHDEKCGELLDYLEAQGLTRDTLVVYVTDNGWIQDPAGNGYAPKSKQSPYDGGLRTPIMLRWPGRVAPGRSDALASSIDIAPTVLAALGLPAPETPLPGINLLDPEAVRTRDAVFGECFTHNAVDVDRPAASLRWRWCIEGSLKLLVPSAANEPQAQVELYDLAADPHETRNLAAERPDDVARLRRRLDAWWPGT